MAKRNAKGQFAKSADEHDADAQVLLDRLERIESSIGTSTTRMDVFESTLVEWISQRDALKERIDSIPRANSGLPLSNSALRNLQDDIAERESEIANDINNAIAERKELSAKFKALADATNVKLDSCLGWVNAATLASGASLVLALVAVIIAIVK